ncbi:MAG TPA: hypothetical protein VK577_01585 [Bradyrhizobium sp.]|nr:hypothetical protein [Bradyrhizobium sp.]
MAHFDRVFDLGLSAPDRRDLVAYLTAVGDGVRPYERDGAGAVLKEINDFSLVLGTAVPANDREIVALAVDTIGHELRELTERYPDRKNTSVSGGQQERGLARVALKELVLTLRRIDIAAAEGRFSDAAAEYKNYRYLMVAAVPALLAGAEPWSLFNPAVHDAHYAALRQVLRTKHTAR